MRTAFGDDVIGLFARYRDLGYYETKEEAVFVHDEAQRRRTTDGTAYPVAQRFARATVTEINVQAKAEPVEITRSDGAKQRLIGIEKYCGQYRVQLQYKGSRFCLGLFGDVHSASAVYDTEAKKVGLDLNNLPPPVNHRLNLKKVLKASSLTAVKKEHGAVRVS